DQRNGIALFFHRPLLLPREEPDEGRSPELLAIPRNAAPGMASLRLERRRRPLRFGAHSTMAAPQQQEALVQLALYLVVGGICFCIDIGGFIALRYVGVAILAASATSFVTATLANYVLCCA